MDVGKAGEKIKSWQRAAGGALKHLALQCGVLWEAVNEKAGPVADRVLARIPEGKRRPVLFCFGGLVVLLLFLVAVLLVMSLRRGEDGRAERRGPSAEIAGPPIPQEELFFPGEPDFVPPLLLERAPRHSWTADDARPFWKDPKELGRDQWQREMSAVIDTLMDSVP
jgi:hypothetical protein